MKKRQKLRLLAAATACLMALTPLAVTADVETPEPPQVTITKVCTTPAQDIKAGSTVDFKVTINVTGEPDEVLDQTAFTDIWDPALKPAGEPQVSEGFKLENSSTGENSATYAILMSMAKINGGEGDEYLQGLVTGDTVTITYPMKIAENAVGKLNNKAVFTGEDMEGNAYREEADAAVELIKDKSPEPQKEGTPDEPRDNPQVKTQDVDKDAKAASPDHSPKTGDCLPLWLLKLLEILGI